MERIVLALGARGLVNAQFIVRDDGVYLIEVNPRASRTVPFLSKVTGVPMVELAVRIALGATLPELGWEGGHLPPPPFVAVKAPAFSTAKLRGVDPSVGPGMQSTGEVIGIHTDPRVALAKALLGAALVPPRPDAAGLARTRLDRRSRQARSCPASRRVSPAPATGWRPHPARGARWRPSATRPSRSPSSGRWRMRPSARWRSSTSSRAATVRLVVNTPTPRSGAVRDAAEIRLAATAEGILCLTAMETAVAAADALDPALADGLASVRALGEWVPEPGQPRRVEVPA